MFGFFFRRLDQWRARLAERAHTPAHGVGLRAEDLAHRYLEQRGYVIVDRNWFDPASLSEIDLVARHEDELVFVEVKARTSDERVVPESAMNAVKQAALRRGVHAYARRAGIPPERVRFDLLTVVFTDPPKVVLYPGAAIRPRRRRNAVC